MCAPQKVKCRLQIIAGRDTKLQDLLVRVSSEALRSSEQFRQLMSSVSPSDLQSDCRCFMARSRFLPHTPLILVVPPLARRQVPQLIRYRARGVARPEVQKIVLVEAEHAAIDYYYWTADAAWDTTIFRTGVHHFHVDGKLVHHSHMHGAVDCSCSHPN